MEMDTETDFQAAAGRHRKGLVEVPEASSSLMILGRLTDSREDEECARCV